MSAFDELWKKVQQASNGESVEIPAALWKLIVTAQGRSRDDMALNHDVLRYRLGLRPWKDFREEKWKENCSDARREVLGNERMLTEKDRCTGRTTRMLVSALVVMSKGLSVQIYGQGSLLTRGSRTNMLIDRLKDMADQLGIDPRLAKRAGHDYKAADVEMFDHSHWEKWG